MQQQQLQPQLNSQVNLLKIFFVVVVLTEEYQLGYSIVCTQALVENQNEAEMKSVCPASRSTGDKGFEGEGMCYWHKFLTIVCFKVCSCLPTRAVEQDVAEGMSPIGSKHKECVMVPNDVLPVENIGSILCQIFEYLNNTF